MRKVLVTGGNGFIGQWVCGELAAREYDVVVLDRNKKPDGLYETFLGDIIDTNAVTEAVAHVDGVIHLAGVLGTQETIHNPRPAAHTNIIGGLNVLEACAQYDVPLVNIAVGNWWMNNTYSISKNTVERFCEMFRVERGARVSVMRALNAYGPGQSVAAPFGTSKVRKIMPAFICRALTNQPIEVYGDGSQIMDMVYVADVARDLVDALEETFLFGGAAEVLESGTGRDTTVLDIATAVFAALDIPGDIRHLPMRPGEPEHSVVKADDPFGDTYTSLEEGVAETVDWFHETRGDTWTWTG